VNTKTKRRLIVVSGIIVIVVILILAFGTGGAMAKTVDVSQAASGEYQDKKIQVTGKVVKDSFEIKDSILTFSIYDPQGDPKKHLRVSYEGSVATTFGADVEAICTGKITAEGVLRATELVTKCPSKYESAEGALSVESLLEYGEAVYGNAVKVSGAIKAGSLKPAGQGDRFVLVDASGKKEFPVEYSAALSEEVKEGSTVVLSGALNAQGKFVATDVALEG